MSATVLPIQTIVRDSQVRSGQPILAGTTLRVSDLVAYHLFDGLSPEQLALQFELNLAQVHAALSYYYSHREEIDAEIRSNAEAADRYRSQLEG
ncbi:MAG: DUF433 domain-containing protein [Acidobacteriota bacterium]|nr:DUF433 domain-containing protein [Acidobacteriota bacterium]